MDFNRLLKKLMFWKKEPEKIIVLKVPEKPKPKLIDPRKLRIHYVCTRCKYKFSRKIYRPVLKKDINKAYMNVTKLNVLLCVKERE